jgi:hypothetical protein
MELPNELKNRKWAQEYLYVLDSMSDKELFDEAFVAQEPDDYDGGWTTRAWWTSILARECLRERFLRDLLLNGETDEKNK